MEDKLNRIEEEIKRWLSRFKQHNQICTKDLETEINLFPDKQEALEKLSHFINYKTCEMVEIQSLAKELFIASNGQKNIELCYKEATKFCVKIQTIASEDVISEAKYYLATEREKRNVIKTIEE